MKNGSKKVELVRNLPVWKFFYKGSHSKPIRTTLAVVNVTRNVVTGYVLRRGNKVATSLETAEIQSFKKSEIASIGQVYADKKKSTKSTLTKHSIASLQSVGV